MLQHQDVLQAQFERVRKRLEAEPSADDVERLTTALVKLYIVLNQAEN